MYCLVGKRSIIYFLLLTEMLGALMCEKCHISVDSNVYNTYVKNILVSEKINNPLCDLNLRLKQLKSLFDGRILL